MAVEKLYCEDCMKPKTGYFQKILSIEKHGLSIYNYRNAELETNESGTIIVHNASDKDLHDIALLEDLRHHKILCSQCKEKVKRVQDILKRISVLRRNEVIGICDHCKGAKHSICCGKCKAITKSFLAAKVKEHKQRQCLLEQWIGKIQELLLLLLGGEVPCYRQVALSDSFIEMQRRLVTPFTVRELAIDTFPFDFDTSQMTPEEILQTLTRNVCHGDIAKISGIQSIEDIKQFSFNGTEKGNDEQELEKNKKDNLGRDTGYPMVKGNRKKDQFIGSTQRIRYHEPPDRNTKKKQKNGKENTSLKGVNVTHVTKDMSLNLGVNVSDVTKDVDVNVKNKGKKKYYSSPKKTERPLQRKELKCSTYKPLTVVKSPQQNRVSKSLSYRKVNNYSGDHFIKVSKDLNLKKNQVKTQNITKSEVNFAPTPHLKVMDKNRDKLHNDKSKPGSRSRTENADGFEIIFTKETDKETVKKRTISSGNIGRVKYKTDNNGTHLRNISLGYENERRIEGEIYDNEATSIKRAIGAKHRSPLNVKDGMLKNKGEDELLNYTHEEIKVMSPQDKVRFDDIIKQNERQGRKRLKKQIPQYKNSRKTLYTSSSLISWKEMGSVETLRCKVPRKLPKEYIRDTVIRSYNESGCESSSEENLRQPIMYENQYIFSKPEDFGKIETFDKNLQTDNIEYQVGIPAKGIVSYRLSDLKFIKNGWTQLPIQNTYRRLCVYRMVPTDVGYDWFLRHKRQILFHNTGEVLAEVDDIGSGKWFYRNGRVALAFTKHEGYVYHLGSLTDNVIPDALRQRNSKHGTLHSSLSDLKKREAYGTYGKFVIYSDGETPDYVKKPLAVRVLATFDYLGNGVVYSQDGQVRLEYNQYEGQIVDPELGPPGKWKWNLGCNREQPLHDIEFTEQHHYDADIQKLMLRHEHFNTKNDFQDAEELICESKELNKEQLGCGIHMPLKIRRLKCCKINKYLTLRVIDQEHIYLSFRHGITSLKVNIGLKIVTNEILGIVKADTTGISHLNVRPTKAMDDTTVASNHNNIGNNKARDR